MTRLRIQVHLPVDVAALTRWQVDLRAFGPHRFAEFVEDAASMSLLFTYGVNFVQGTFRQAPEKVMSYDFGG